MKTLLTKRAAVGLALFACSASTLHAEVRFNGFASIRATAVDSDTGVPPLERYKGDGDISFKDESLFALQASSDLGEGLTATVQLIAEGTEDFDVEARWAYISYAINDTHTLSAGRVANPIFNQSQYEKVGYAHNFARLPKAVYDDFDFTTLEGVSLDSSFFLGDLSLDTKVSYGSWEGTIATETFGIQDSGLDDILSLNAVLSGDWWKVFAGGFVAEFRSENLDNLFLAAFTPAVQAAQATGATAQQVAAFEDYVRSDGGDTTYVFAGFGIDYENFIIDFEYANYDVEDSPASEKDVWFAAIGYRFGSSVITVHAEDYGVTEKPPVNTALGNPILIATANGLSQAAIAREFDGYGITWRYDFHPSAALKVDYFSGEDNREEIGDYSIASIGLDIVF